MTYVNCMELLFMNFILIANTGLKWLNIIISIATLQSLALYWLHRDPIKKTFSTRLF